MSSSADVAAGDDVLATDHNTLRKDALGRISLELAENMTAGDFGRIIDSSGAKAKKLFEAGAGTIDISGFGTEQTIAVDNVGVTNSFLCKVTSSKVCAVYWDNTSAQARVRIGTVASGIITWGTAVQIPGSKTGNQNLRCCYVDDDKILITYENSSGATFRAVVATISGTTPSFGTAVAIGSFACDKNDIKRLDTTRVFFAFINGSTNHRAVILSISGTTITVGTDVNLRTYALLGSGSMLRVSLELLDTDKVIVTFCEAHHTTPTTNTPGYAVICTIATATITVGTPVNFAAVAYNPCVCKVTTTKAYVLYYAPNTSKLSGMVLDISGTTITTNTVEDVKTSYSIENNHYVSYIQDSNVLLSYYDDEARTGIISGGSITLRAENAFNASAIAGETMCICLTSILGVIAYRDTDDDKKAIVATITPPDIVNNTSFSIVAVETGTTGQTKLFNVMYSINDNQSGMTPGAIQYIDQTTGNRTASVTAYKAGRALSATSMLITNSP